MTTISTADLTSELVDLTNHSLRDLRKFSQELAGAITGQVEFAMANGDENQVQNQ